MMSGSVEYLEHDAGRGALTAHAAASEAQVLHASMQSRALGLRWATQAHRSLQLSGVSALALSQFQFCFRERRPAKEDKDERERQQKDGSKGSAASRCCMGQDAVG